mgnify:CR=1 FL=1
MYLIPSFLHRRARTREVLVPTLYTPIALGDGFLHDNVTVTPHVVVAFAIFLEQFVEDPLTIVSFLVPRQQMFLLDPVARRKRIDILGR